MSERVATTPIASAGSGAVGGGLNAALVAWIIGSNPELLAFAPAIGALFQGALNGLGNLARTWKQSDDPGMKLLGTVLAAIG